MFPAVVSESSGFDFDFDYDSISRFSKNFRTHGIF